MSHIPRQAVGLIRFHYTQKDTVCTEGNAGRPRPRLSFSVRSAPGGSVCPDFSVPALPRGSVQICMERFIPSRKGSRRHGTIDMVSANPDIISTSRIWLLEHRPGNTRGGFFVHRADCRCVHGALLVLTSLRRSVTILQQTPGRFFCPQGGLPVCARCSACPYFPAPLGNDTAANTGRFFCQHEPTVNCRSLRTFLVSARKVPQRSRLKGRCVSRSRAPNPPP